MNFSGACPYVAKLHKLSRYGDYGNRITYGRREPFCDVGREMIFGLALDHIEVGPMLLPSVVCDSSTLTSGNELLSTSLRLEQEAIRNDSHPYKHRVLCVILTYDGNHALTRAAADTWGSECSGFLAFSNTADYGVPTVSIPHPTVPQESIQYYWRKKRDIYRYVHRWYTRDFDYVLFSDDDSFIIPNNLFQFIHVNPVIRQLRADKLGVFAGRPMRYHWEPDHPDYPLFYNGGGHYLMDTLTLEAVVQAVDLQLCNHSYPDDRYGDVILAKCLLRHPSRTILPADTRDLAHPPYPHRFHMISPESVVEYTGLNYSDDTFYRLSSYEFVPGLEGLARDSVSFHMLKSPQSMYALQMYLDECTARP